MDVLRARNATRQQQGSAVRKRASGLLSEDPKGELGNSEVAKNVKTTQLIHRLIDPPNRMTALVMFVRFPTKPPRYSVCDVALETGMSW